MVKYAWLLIFLFAACTSKKGDRQQATYSDEIRYASGFHFEADEDQRYLVVDQPWPGASEPIRYSLEAQPRRLVCTSTSHLPYLELLGAENAVVGFPNVAYISSKVFINRAKEGAITDLGPDGSLNMELLLGIAPDAVVAFDMGGESQSLDKIKEAGIEVYYNADFLEATPLGRAEWIKFFGALLDREEKADSIFNTIEKRYKELQQIATQVSDQPTIMSGVVYGDTWFLPGGNNWSARFFEDAGGSYIWQQDSTSGWKELGFESVYEKAHDADFWIGTSTLNSRAELVGQDSRYADFEAYQADRVYSYNKRVGPNGGYDFFESGYARPELVLSDLIKILHPELLPRYETVYFQRLK